jgi:hypothetical protein
MRKSGWPKSRAITTRSSKADQAWKSEGGKNFRCPKCRAIIRYGRKPIRGHWMPGCPNPNCDWVPGHKLKKPSIPYRAALDLIKRNYNIRRVQARMIIKRLETLDDGKYRTLDDMGGIFIAAVQKYTAIPESELLRAVARIEA